MRSIEELLKLLGTSKVSEVQIERDRGGGVGAILSAVQANLERRRANPWVARHGKVSHSVTAEEKEALLAAGASAPPSEVP